MTTLTKTGLFLALAFTSLHAEVDMTKPLPQIQLSGDKGGYYSGKDWNSDMLKGKTSMLMYVDLDEKYRREIFKPTIENFEKDLDFNKFQIIVIINLKATWKPNALIKKMMKSNMKEVGVRVRCIHSIVSFERKCSKISLHTFNS